jgi:hypothetical protein
MVVVVVKPFTQMVLEDGTMMLVNGLLRLKHYVYDTKLKNLIERLFVQQIKDRTECFDDHFPCRKQNCNRQHVWNWLKLFVLYLHMGIDRIQFITFLVTNGWSS